MAVVALAAATVHAAQVDIPGPAGSGAFGTTVTVLPNGNFVVTDPSYSIPLGAANVGAVYLYSPTGTLISTLTGSTANDQVGSGGVTVLTNGNYVVRSSNWNGTAGAVTWGSGTTGVSGTVSAANSLVGSTANDFFAVNITVLPNGNYVVASPVWDGAAADVGAVTWCNGTTGLSGVVSASNSLVGSTASDVVGNNGVFVLTNGNYLVNSVQWDGAATNVGAVTWCNGTTGLSGAVSAANSLVGSMSNDGVGTGVTVLTNGNYVVRSPAWDGAAVNVGAVTWCNGTTGIVGAVSAANSLVGSTANDQVSSGGVTVLTNGNYVVRSNLWDGAATNVGAVTWADGTTAIVGAVSAGNSLVGSTANDQVGSSGVTALSNGNYVVRSPNWDDAAADVGAVTWGNGTTGIVGAVSAANSLVGSTINDQVGNDGVTALTNGNYVVRSSDWDGAAVNVGAVTWGDGTTGIVGTVSAANSLIGSTANDMVGEYGVTTLSNGNFVVISSDWDGADVDVGAVTWGSGTTGILGAVSAANSLVGSTANDQVGVAGVTALNNGNYVVSSPNWDSAAANVGAVTWGNGTTGIVGAVSAGNSLVGSTAGDQVGNLTALTNGNYSVISTSWDGAVINVGAVTWCSGITGLSGVVSAGNSLTGGTANDVVGNFGITAQSNGNYVVRSPNWDGATADSGAISFGSGISGTVGVINAINSVRGTAAGGGIHLVFAYDASLNQLVVGRRADNIVTLFIPNMAPTDLALAPASIAENSSVGTTVGTLSATDPDAGETFTFTLAAGTGDTDNASFTITGTTLQTAAVFDFETKNSHSIRVRVTDSALNTFEKAFAVTVSNVNETPGDVALSSASIAENSSVGTAVGTLSATDPDAGETFTFTLAAGTGDTDNASFTITGTILQTAAVFDFETKNSHSIRVRVTDLALNTFEKAFAVTVSNVNDAPAITSALTFTPAQPLEGQLVSFAINASDPDGDTLTLSFVYGDGATGAAASHAYAAAGSYTVTVTVSDGNGGSVESTATVVVTADTDRDGTPNTLDDDDDGDGFSDVLESELGTNPASATDTPLGGASVGTPLPLTIQKMSIKLSFAKTGGDSLSLGGTLPVSAGLVLANQVVVIDIGGVIRKFTLSAKGQSPKGVDSFKLGVKAKKGVVAAQTSKFQCKFSRGTFATQLADEGLTGDATVKNANKTVRVNLYFNSQFFQKDQAQSFTAKSGVSGATK